MQKLEKKSGQVSIEAATREDYVAVFTSPVGKNVLKDMGRAHNLLTSTFDENPHVMALKEGERNVVLRILTFLNMRPEEVERR